MRWGVIDNSLYVVWSLLEENRDHLFFQSSFTQAVWRGVLARLVMDYQGSCWEEELEHAVNSIHGKVAFTVCSLYGIWQLIG